MNDDAAVGGVRPPSVMLILKSRIDYAERVIKFKKAARKMVQESSDKDISVFADTMEQEVKSGEEALEKISALYEWLSSCDIPQLAECALLDLLMKNEFMT